MRMRPAVLPLAAACLFLVLGHVVPCAFGADPLPPGAKVPRFTVKDVALTQAGLPEGWKVAPAEPVPTEDKLLRDGIAAAAIESKEPDVVPLTVALLTPEGKAVVLALVDALRDPEAFSTAAKAAAAKHGWAYRDLGTPARFVLVAGPEEARATALAAQVAAAVRYLAQRAADALEKWRAGKEQAMAAYVLSQDVLNLDPKHAPSHHIKGDMILRMHLNGRDDALPGDAAAHLHAAVAKDATSPLTGDRVAQANTRLCEALGRHGEALLLMEPPKNEQARDVLKEAVALLASTKQERWLGLGFRYNLACAHSRLKEKDLAFALLTPLLEELAKDPEPRIDDIWRSDPDLALLHEDPRWAHLVKRYPEKAAEGPK